MIRAVQEFYCVYGLCREVQMADGPHYPVLLSIEQMPYGVQVLGVSVISAPALRVKYRGHKEDLMALGCVSRDRLASARPGRYEDVLPGALLHVESKPAPGRRGMIELSYVTESRSFASALPGLRTYCADWLGSLTPRPMLRLVVDNTRP